MSRHKTTTLAVLLCIPLLTMGTACPVEDGNVTLPPRIILSTPNEDDLLLINYDSLEIEWLADDGVAPEVRVELFRNGLEGSAELIGIYPANDYYTTPLSIANTGPASDNCVIKITDTSNEEIFGLSGVFSIIEPGLYYKYYLFGDLYTGNLNYIKWHAEATSQASILNVKVELTRDNGSTWEVLSASTPAADGYILWTVTDGGLPTPQTECMFRITDVDNAANTDTSIPFTIYEPN